MLYYHYGGAATTHKLGCVCHHINDTLWYITQFQTDYMYIIDGKSDIGKPGEITIVTPGHTFTHSNTDDMSVGFVNDYLYFSSSNDIYELMKELQLPLNRAFNSCDAKLLDPYIRQMQYENQCRKLGFKQKISSLMNDMLVKMSRQHEKSENRASPQKILIEKARAEMLANYNKNWTLAKLASTSGYTPAISARSIRKCTG